MIAPRRDILQFTHAGERHPAALAPGRASHADPNLCRKRQAQLCLGRSDTKYERLACSPAKIPPLDYPTFQEPRGSRQHELWPSGTGDRASPDVGEWNSAKLTAGDGGLEENAGTLQSSSTSHGQILGVLLRAR